MERGIELFNTDKPINDTKSDLLNRASFAKQLASAILSYTNTDNFTISICGKWGSGKTSILNLMEENIINLTSSLDENKKPIIIHFNPWNYSDQNQLIIQFFATICEELNIHSKSESLVKIGTALQAYSEFFDYAELIPVAGKFIKIAKLVMKRTGEEISKGQSDNLSIKKKEVTEALLEQQQKLIVIIDDIDRLNNNQIRSIFQLVNSLAGFPNMIYLLSFDREVVARALSEEQNCDGEEYLEKIIQVPFDIPEAKQDLVHKVLFDKLDKLWFGDNPCSDFEEDYWNSIFNHCISPFIKSIRDVNRIINVYQFKYALVRDETNGIDLLAITTLQICAPEIYDWIYTNIDSICGSVYTLGMSADEQKKTYNNYLESFEEIYYNPQLMMQVIQTIFPKFSFRTGGYYHSKDSEEELRRKQKIACNTRSSLYFTLSLEDVTISKQELLDSINSYEEDELNIYYNDLVKHNKMLEYARELCSYTDDIPEERKELILTELINQLTIADNNESKGLFQASPSYYLSECIWKILNSFPKEMNEQLFLKLLNSAQLNVFSVVVGLILETERAYGRIGDNINYNYRFLDETQLDNIETTIINLLDKRRKKEDLLSASSFYFVYVFWYHIDKSSLDEYMKTTLGSAVNVLKYLTKICASHWNSSRGSGWRFKSNGFDGYISDENAYQSILSLKHTEEFRNMDEQSKRTAVAFCLWFETKERYIEDKSVDEHIGDWM